MPLLVVDDNKNVRELLCNYLQDDHEVLGVSTADAAIALAEMENLELAFVDVTLPEIDGVELSRRLSTIRPDLPIVLMSGYADLEKRALELPNVVAFLMKPFDLDKLEEITKRWLRNRG
jgi:DNA-binding NtrC family response regulator